MPDPDQVSSWGPPPYAPGGYDHPSYPAPPAPAGFVTQPYGPAGLHARAPIEVTMVPPRPSGRGLAITGVVLGGLALLGVLLMGLFFVVTVVWGFADGGGAGGGGYGPMNGTIAPATGSALTGSALASEVTKTVLADGGEPEDVVCPDTPRIAQDVTTVCHGTDFGEESAFVVFFEDAQGDYTILEL